MTAATAREASAYDPQSATADEARKIVADLGKLMGEHDRLMADAAEVNWRPGEGGEPQAGIGSSRAAGRLRPLGTREMLAMTPASRHPPLAPILTEGGLTLVHGPHGIGLSQVTTACAAAIITAGSFIGWRAAHARRVLLISGGLPSVTLAARLRGVLPLVEGRKGSGERLQVLAPDLHRHPMPALDTALGCEMMAPLVDACDVVIIDDASLLVPDLADNVSLNRWRFGEFLRGLRRQRKSVLIAQHSGREVRERAARATLECLYGLADVVIGLRRPGGYVAGDGARFEVHIERAGHLPDAGRTSQEVRLLPRGEDRIGWSTEDASEATRRRFLALIEEGLPAPDAARELGLPRTTAWRWLRKAQAKSQSMEAAAVVDGTAIPLADAAQAFGQPIESPAVAMP